MSTAFSLHLGVNVMGQSGTGKTETIKELAKTIGKHCIVYNCSEQISIRIIGKLLIGLCYTGAWSCFDEFNRIDVEVLSIIAQNFREIKRAKDRYKSEFLLEDRKVLLNPTMGFYATMNLDYDGRHELPDNIKLLLRPVSMSSPDKLLIIEGILSSEGFYDSKRLALKVVKFLQLVDDQLSQQLHYSFGLRGIVSAIAIGGRILRKHDHPDEDKIAIKMLKDSFLGKLTDEDRILFMLLIKEIFDVEEEDEHSEFKKALKFCMRKLNLAIEEELVEKVVQLHLIVQLRAGIMITGTASSGKTTILNLLRSLLSVDKIIAQELINPKALTIGELYGETQLPSNIWKEGILGTIFRNIAKNRDDHENWIVFDGPLDSYWVENLNSLLDDNRILCLPNQERIKLSEKTRMFFEVDNVMHASPAAISRCGIIYMSEKTIKWKSILTSFLNSEMDMYPNTVIDLIMTLSFTYIERILELRKSLKTIICSENNSLVLNFCIMLRCSMKEINGYLSNLDSEKESKMIEKVFVFCVTWTFGGNLDNDSLVKFDQDLGSIIQSEFPKGSIYDSFVRANRSGGEYIKWESLLEPLLYSPTTPFYELYIPTKTTAKYLEMIIRTIQTGRPVYLAGHSGVGKSKLAELAMNQLKVHHNTHSTSCSFTVGTLPSDFKEILYKSLECKRKHTLEASSSRNAVICVDDVNLPRQNEFGSQPVLEFLRRLFEHQTFYDNEKGSNMSTLRTNYLCSAGAGNMSEPSLRFIRHFHVLTVPDVNEEMLIVIYKTILENFLGPFTREIRGICGAIVAASICVYEQCHKELKPTPSKSFYIISFRDMQRVFRGLLRATPDNYKTCDSLVKLWIHENMRTYHDRLFLSGRDWFINLLNKATNRYFRKGYTSQQFPTETNKIICDFTQNENSFAQRDYIISENNLKLLSTVTKIISNNEQFSSIILFQSTLRDLCKITRVLGTEQGHALVIGISGTGKKTLIKLATSLYNFTLFSISLTKSYTRDSWREDIKKIYLSFARELPCPGVFLITEDSLFSESFLEDINSMLSSTKIPNLFTIEELETLNYNLHHLVPEGTSLYDYFIQQVRNNLHIIISLCPDPKLVSSRTGNFPSLLSATTIIMIDPWPFTAMIEVAKSRLPFTDPASKYPQLASTVYTIVQELSAVYNKEAQIKTHVTPKVFLCMLDCLTHLLTTQDFSLKRKKLKYTAGYEQIAKSHEEIQKMKGKLKELIPAMEHQKIENEALTWQLAHDTFLAHEEKSKIEEEEKDLKQQSENYKVLKEEARSELRKALPALEEAVRALKALSQTDISEIRTFSNPPPLTLYTFEAIAILFEVPQNWETLKKMLLNNFFEKLQNFPRNSIKPSTLKKLREKIKANPSFKPEQVGHQNVASRSLCKWVYAIEQYSRVAMIVKPRRLTLKNMNAALNESLNTLSVARKKLETQFQRVRDLEEQLGHSLEVAAALAEEIARAHLRIDRAKTLTENLKEEAGR